MITIILPVRNEAQYINKCLDSILMQVNLKGPLEILIADGMSSDATRGVIRSYQENHPFIHLIDNPGQIVPTGMNLALRQSTGEIIIRVDGHCIIASDYVEKCIKHLNEDGIAGVGGPMESIGETKISETIALAMSSKFGVGNSAFRTTFGKTILADTVPFPAYTREIIQKIGLYDEELKRNQDDEYNYRIREHGGKLLLADDIHSKYFSRGSLGKLWQQYLQYGYFKVRVFQKHPKQMSLRQFIPPFFVFSLLVSIILTLTTKFGWWLLSLSGGSYLIANIVSSIIISLKKRGQHLALLPITFLIIHMSYGLGFLAGLVRFWNRWGDKKGMVPDF